MLPVFEEGQRVEELYFRETAQAEAEVITFPGDMMSVEEIDDDGEIEAAGWDSASTGNTARGASPQCNAVRQSGTKLVAKVVATEGEGVGKGIIVREVGMIVIADGFKAVSSDEAVESAIVPFALDGGPVVIDVVSVMRGEVVWSDGASFAIGLGKVGGDAKLSGLGVFTEVVVEGVILLAGDDHVFDKVIATNGRCGIGYYRLIRTTACRDGETCSCQRSQCSQHAAPCVICIE